MDTSGIFVKNELPSELSEKEVNDLLKKIRGNDQLAKEKLILHCTGFTVRYVTKKYGHRSDKKEILSRALTGVVKGVNNYDYKKSDNFMAFVYVCFTNEIKMYFNKLNKLKYHEMLLMDEPISDDKKNRVIDTINSGVNIEKTYEKKELYNRIRELVDELGKKNSEIVKLYYGFNNNDKMIQEEVGNKLNISKQYVNKILIESIEILKRKLISEGIIEIKSEKERKQASYKSIYEYFKDYSKEEIDYAISKLNNYYIELLKLKFWKDFNISDNKRLDRHENKLFYTGVVRKVKKLIKEKN